MRMSIYRSIDKNLPFNSSSPKKSRSHIRPCNPFINVDGDLLMRLIMLLIGN